LYINKRVQGYHYKSTFKADLSLSVFLINSYYPATQYTQIFSDLCELYKVQINSLKSSHYPKKDNDNMNMTLRVF